MYLAKKDGASCRIPDRSVDYYKSMGYELTKLDGEDSKKTSEKKSAKAVKQAEN